MSASSPYKGVQGMTDDVEDEDLGQDYFPKGNVVFVENIRGVQNYKQAVDKMSVRL